MKGVSEYVSALLLMLIVLGGGVIIYLTFTSSLTSERQGLERSFIETRIAVSQNLVVSAAYINYTGDLVVIIVSDHFPVRLWNVYVNDTLYTSSCTISVESSSSSVYRYVLPPYSIGVLKCPVSGSGSVYFRITYDGGVVEGYAVRLG